MNNNQNVYVDSEIGKLEGVILHRPGKEVENMIPGNAERALYSDILNLTIASEEYSHLEKILNKLTKCYQVNDLLKDILEDKIIRNELINEVCKYEKIEDIGRYLQSLDVQSLANQLIEGVFQVKDNLTKYLDKNRYILNPLHNFFFMRDAAFVFNDDVIINNMANKIRSRETTIMKAIFEQHPLFNLNTFNIKPDKIDFSNCTIEGGDILIIGENIILIGLGSRTSSQGIDFIIDILKEKKGERKHIIVQELPKEPESFIHLDMIFTMLDFEDCMVYERLIMGSPEYFTIHLVIDNGKVIKIEKKENLLIALKQLGYNLKPLKCGGNDEWIQEREQWHSGANFFAVAPGKVIGYQRNNHTLDILSKAGYEIIQSTDIIMDKKNIDNYKKAVITIPGSELARGGGGARCMTMPIARSSIS